MKDGFYESEAWRELRYKVIRLYGRKCGSCGCESGEAHVDHILPRSQHPDLELVVWNLQVLCKDCNLGKSNKDKTDFRDPLLVKAMYLAYDEGKNAGREEGVMRVADWLEGQQPYTAKEIRDAHQRSFPSKNKIVIYGGGDPSIF